jgi:hypothetical protein
VSWTKHDDQRPFNRKMLVVSGDAYRLDDQLIAWCSMNRTDGLISAEELPQISSSSTQPRLIAELVRRGRLHQYGDPHCGHPADMCVPPGEDGYSVHDYLEFNPTAEEADKEARANAERQRRYREKRHASRNGVGNASRNASRNASGNASDDALVTRLVTAPRPVPSRPQTGRETHPPPSVASPAADGDGASADDEQTPPVDSTIGGGRAAAIASIKTTLANARRAARRPPPAAGSFEKLIDETGGSATSAWHDAIFEPGSTATANGVSPMTQPDPATAGTADDGALTADADTAAMDAEATQDGDGSMGDTLLDDGDPTPEG